MTDEGKLQENKTRTETRRIFCNRCVATTIHALRFTHHGSDGEASEDRYSEVWTDSLWSCCGCESATLEHYWELEGTEGEIGAPRPETHYYPAREKKQRKVFVKLPDAMSQLYAETIDAFNSNSMLLCSIGLRTLIEGICNDQGIPGNSLSEKIEGLSPIVPNKKLIDSLHSFRHGGNDATHELVALRPFEASFNIEVMEGLFNFLYHLDYTASRMKNASRVKA